MKLSHSRVGSPLAGLLVILVIALGFVVQRQITVAAFDRVEADQVAQDAQRIRIALDYEIRLLSDYGATNSIWDSSFADVREADGTAFEADFPPSDIRRIYGVDGVVGTGPDGTVRVGGMVGAGSAFAPLPADLAEPALLHRLFAADAEAGSARCGVVRTSGTPFLYCGFASYPGDGDGEPAGGLIYFKALGEERLTAIGKQIGLPVKLVSQARATGERPLTLSSRLGDLKVVTGALDDDRISVNVALPAVEGTPVLLEAVRDRPIHETATVVLRDVFLMTAAAGALLLAVMVLLVRQGIRRQVRPLRRTAEAVIASGDRTLRVRSGDEGEIGALGRAIDTMLDAMAAQDTELEQANAAREEQLRITYAERQLSEQQARQRAQEMINSSVSTIMGELHVVAEKTDELRGTAETIDERVSVTDAVTHRVVEQVRRANDTVEQLEASLRKVEGIAHIISNVATQTHLLALNATIEAVRAGEAGKGFSVVANEVKELATTTTQSTDEITAIIRSLEENATAMAGALTEMTGGVGNLDEAAAQVGDITRQQHSSVDLLKEYLDRAIRRISTMADLAAQLERRGFPRAAVGSGTWVHAAGGKHPVELLDLSASGAHCSTGRDVPFKKGDLVEIDIPLQGESPLALKAEIVNHRKHGDGAEIRLHFTAVSQAAEERINRYVIAVLSEQN
ncbi:PilZ domain-containing protein [Planomonospora sp. ID67723]|uniref:methyl-accepting chemotaxis protein n=1 Tax=Planomonospora sp. ID67723 TaxID=2738134 RepID=UPI0018C365AF|nr:methyl-accepting chemotaxis protein [Planomonospora sp. ID67723]MBG0828975.1 PilZ domain-containing protein [Planomonospora sp. ID67723]